MRRSRILDALSKRAPAIVIVTLCSALGSYWLSAPLWLPECLAIIVAGLALVLMAARGRRAQFSGWESSGGSSDKNWIAQELAGNGTPAGFYLFGFFGCVTIMLTGVEGAYATPAWAALALAVAWGFANARYTDDDGSKA